MTLLRARAPFRVPPGTARFGATLVRGLLALAPAVGCSASRNHDNVSEGGALSTLATRDVMLDPWICNECHQDHFADWARSMHAGASDDPVFVAMNARGQRETSHALGTFCVQCHAPMAVREGLTTDGLNLPTLPAKYRGVTCFFCHSIASVTDSHNASLVLAKDLAMRGEIADPIPNAIHASVYSPLEDGERREGADTCGSCHDIVVPSTLAPIERTYYEWSHSVFSTSTGSTCIQCHMVPSGNPAPIARVPNAPLRTVHGHEFPAVDTALGPAVADAGADSNEGASSVQQTLNGGVLAGALCVTGAGGVRVILDPVGVGHAWPSGAAQDRRAWVEIIAYRGGDVIYESGVVPHLAAVTSQIDDPDLWLLRDCMFDAAGKQVNMFWEVSASQGNELPALATFDSLDPRFYATHIVQRFPRTGSPLAQFPDRVTMRLRLQPIGLDVLGDLVATGDLDPAVPSEMPTFDVSLTGPTGLATLEWKPGAALAYDNADDGTPGTCVATSGFNVNATATPATNPTKCAP